MYCCYWWYLVLSLSHFVSAKYPQVKKLMGTDPNLKYAVVFMVLLQLLAAYLMRQCQRWAHHCRGLLLWGASLITQ